MKRKLVIPILAVVIIGLSAAFLLRAQSQQASNALTPADEKLMRTPQGVIPMPAEALRAMQDANKRRR